MGVNSVSSRIVRHGGQSREELSNGHVTNGGNRPKTVIHWDHAQGPLADQKAAVGPTFIILPQVNTAAIGAAAGGRTLAVDHATREAGEDRGESGQPRPVRHVPIGRSGGAEGTVPENPEPD